MAEGQNCANSQEEQAEGQCAKLQAGLIALGDCQVNGKDGHEQSQMPCKGKKGQSLSESTSGQPLTACGEGVF